MDGFWFMGWLFWDIDGVWVYSVGDDGGLRSKGTKAKKVVCVLVLVSVLKVVKFVWGCGRKASALLGLCDVHRLWWWRVRMKVVRGLKGSSSFSFLRCASGCIWDPPAFLNFCFPLVRNWDGLKHSTTKAPDLSFSKLPKLQKLQTFLNKHLLYLTSLFSSLNNPENKTKQPMFFYLLTQNLSLRLLSDCPKWDTPHFPHQMASLPLPDSQPLAFSFVRPFIVPPVESSSPPRDS